MLMNPNSLDDIKITDLGISEYFYEEGFGPIKLKEICGTLKYMAPEIIAEKGYDYKVDVWSIGVITYQLVN